MIFFDLDGTLMDHKTSEYLAVKDFYFSYREDFDCAEDEFYKLWKKLSTKYFTKYLAGQLTFAQQRIERIKDLFQSAGVELSDAEAGEKFKTYLAKYKYHWQPYDDVLPCLQRLEENYRLGIITNGDHQQQLLKLEKIGVEQFFEVVVTAGEIGAAKPDQEIFQVACKRVGVQPKDCYYIGDDLETDILGCQKADMKGIWLNREQEPRERKDIETINSLEDLEGGKMLDGSWTDNFLGF